MSYHLRKTSLLYLRQICMLGGAFAAAFVCTTPEAYADIIQLKTGGHLTGTVIDRGKQGEYVVQSDTGGVVTLTRRQVAKVKSQNKVDLEYAKRSRELPDTVEAHRELAQWCKENKLDAESKRHIRRIFELDPTDEEARLSLGYQQHQGHWMTRDEIMATRGLTKYEGDFLTTQHIALRKQAKQQKELEVDWLHKIRKWVGWLDSRRASEAAQLISDVKDPNAAKAIVDILEKTKNQKIRDLLTATLAEIQHPLTVTTLVDFSLNEPDPEVREQCLDYLIQFHQPVSLVPYISALNDRKYNNKIINRAALALHRIKNPEAISPLIDALVTTHRVRISDAPIGNTQATFTPGGGGGGGFSAGNKPKFRRQDFPNLPVRQALVELSGGQNFEYDEKVWRRWFVNEQISEYVDARRDQ